MVTNRWRKTGSRANESGQALMFLVLALGLVFLGAGALSVDMSNLWFHRQAAQNAADAACTAGAMDLLVDAQGGATGHQGFVNGTAFNCSTGSTAAPCQYAAKNGYNSDVTGNLVSVSFPATVPGVPPSAIPPAGIAPTTFVRVDVTDNIPTYFSGLLSGSRTQTLRAFAVCGVVLAKAPIPILLLNPTVSGSLSGNGTPTIRILGGAKQSIQINSQSTSAVTFGGTIDLSKGGPGFNGSDLGTYGGPSTPTGTFLPGTNGTWRSPTSPISDPYAGVAAPTIAGMTAQAGPYLTGTHLNGCPDPAGCDEYAAGYYATGIQIKNVTAIFDPGVYYLNGTSSGGPLELNANSMVRPSTVVPPAPNNIGGTIFYLTGVAGKCSGQNGLVCVGSNSGKAGLTPFNTSLVQCPGGPAPDPALGLPATLDGNVLLAPCTGPYGDPLGQYRGILFFGDRGNGSGGGWGGGGGFLLAGSMYFHQCNSTGVAGSGTNCATAGAFNAQFQFQGNSGSASYVLGDIVTDTLNMGGTPNVNMALNPAAAYNTLKASLLR